MGERERITLHLQLIFSVTFAPNAFFYVNPDVDQFLAVLLHVASHGRVRVDADLRRLFLRAANGTYHVDEVELLNIGCTKLQLCETLSRTPGADLALRHANAAPLVLLSPLELLNYSTDGHQPAMQLASVVQQPAEDDDLLTEDDLLAWLGDLPVADDLSEDLLSVTATYVPDGGGDAQADDAALADSFTSSGAPLDLTALFTSSFDGAIDLDDTARRLLLVEHELQNVQLRIQLLLPHGEAVVLAIAAALDEVRETVRNHRADVQEQHDASVGRQLASPFQ